MSKEHDTQTLAQRNNLIRAAVMGANDGILSVSGIVIGVAGRQIHLQFLLLVSLVRWPGQFQWRWENIHQFTHKMMRK